MTVYKMLPDGGFTSMPTTAVNLPRLIKQGWSETMPVVPAAPIEAVADDAPKKRGRKAAELVN